MKHDNLGYHFTVMVDNGFQGREFVLRDEEEVRAFGISLTSVKGVLYGWGMTVYGMRVKRVSLSGLDRGLTQYQDIKALFVKNRAYFSTLLHPIIGEVVGEGEYQGTRFSFFSHAEHGGCFNKQQVRLALIDPTFCHRGCTFRHASTREAIPYHHHLTVALIAHLKAHFSGRGCNQHFHLPNGDVL